MQDSRTPVSSLEGLWRLAGRLGPLSYDASGPYSQEVTKVTTQVTQVPCAADVSGEEVLGDDVMRVFGGAPPLNLGNLVLPSPDGRPPRCPPARVAATSQ